MPQTKDRGSAKSRQPPTVCLLLPMGWWFALPDTWATRRGAMILWRGLHRRDGGPLVTSEYLAQECGDADRRNVHNFWAEFEACGADLAAFLPRRKQGDTAVVARGEPLGKRLPYGPVPTSSLRSGGVGPSRARP